MTCIKCFDVVSPSLFISFNSDCMVVSPLTARILDVWRGHTWNFADGVFLRRQFNGIAVWSGHFSHHHSLISSRPPRLSDPVPFHPSEDEKETEEKYQREITLLGKLLTTSLQSTACAHWSLFMASAYTRQKCRIAREVSAWNIWKCSWKENRTQVRIIVRTRGRSSPKLSFS